MTLLDRLQTWYAAQCDGEWEHAYGVSIDTLDNPGWMVRVDLVGTALAPKPFNTIRNEVADDNWFHCWVAEGSFQGAGGPRNLSDILQTFLDWAELA